MSHPELFPASASLEDSQETIISFQMKLTANLISIQGRNAVLDNGTKLNVNLAEFDPKLKKSEINKSLVFVKKSDADPAFLAKMAAESRSPLGGAGKEFNVFIEGSAEKILIFFKKS